MKRGDKGGAKIIAEWRWPFFRSLAKRSPRYSSYRSGYVRLFDHFVGAGKQKRREIQPRCDPRATAVALDSRYRPGYRRRLGAGAWATTTKPYG